jgi:hypothetical protein
MLSLMEATAGWTGYFSYGSVTKARHDVKLHLYHAVRRFLRRRHKVAGPGYRQCPLTDVFGKLGVLARTQEAECGKSARSV